MDMVRVLAFILLVVLLVILGPIITIWSLNTVFGLGIGYTIWTWLGTVWLQLLIVGSNIKTKG